MRGIWCYYSNAGQQADSERAVPQRSIEQKDNAMQSQSSDLVKKEPSTPPTMRFGSSQVNAEKPSSQLENHTATSHAPRSRSHVHAITTSERLKAERRGLIEALADLLEEVKVKERELKNIAKHLDKNTEVVQGKDDELALLKQRYSVLQTSRDHHEATAASLRTGIGTLENELRGVRGRLATCQEDLKICRDDIFRLQPIDEVPDADVSSEFDSLCQQIANWVEEEMQEFEVTNPVADADDIFSDGGDERVAALLRKNRDVGEFLVRYKIHRSLNRAMFDDGVYLLGISNEVGEILSDTEQAMGNLQPARGRCYIGSKSEEMTNNHSDIATIRTWRSETLKALSATTVCVEKRDQQIQHLTFDLQSDLESIFPIIGGNDSSLQRLYDQIMLPAAELASKVHTSSTKYEFGICKTAFPVWGLLTRYQMRNNKLVDVKTRKTLKPSSAVIEDEDGRIGNLVLPLEPSLKRVDKDGKTVLLRPKTYLVELDHPVGKRAHTS